ncbi:MAG: type II toxin-antitoxin system Phd/YefM family antitoxin [Pseudonocardia sp.]
MAEFGVHEAKTHFSKLLERALAGEEIIITRSGEPLVRLVPAQRAQPPDPGWAAGTFEVPDDFDELPDELMEHFR